MKIVPLALLFVALTFAQTKPVISQIDGGKISGLVFIDTSGRLQTVTIDATLVLTNTGTGWKLSVAPASGSAPVRVPNVDAIRQTNGSYLVSDIALNVKSVEVSRNGVLQRPASDYVVTGGSVGGAIITPVGDPWSSTDVILVAYQRL